MVIAAGGEALKIHMLSDLFSMAYSAMSMLRAALSEKSGGQKGKVVLQLKIHTELYGHDREIGK